MTQVIHPVAPEGCLLAVQLYPDHAKVAVPGRDPKNVTVPDLMSLLNTGITGSSDVGDIGTMDLPAGVIRFSRNATTMRILMYIPEKQVKVTHTRLSSPKDMWFPNMVLNFTLERHGDEWHLRSNTWSSTSLSRDEVASLPEKYPNHSNSSRQLHRLPLPNIYHEGGVCLGSNEMPVKFKDSTLKGLFYYWDFLHQSPFNNDLSIPCRNAPDRADDYLQWHHDRIQQGQTGFPYEILN